MYVRFHQKSMLHPIVSTYAASHHAIIVHLDIAGSPTSAIDRPTLQTCWPLALLLVARDVSFPEGVVWPHDDVGNAPNSWSTAWCRVIRLARKSSAGKAGGGRAGLARWYHKEGRGNDVIGMG